MSLMTSINVMTQSLRNFDTAVRVSSHNAANATIFDPVTGTSTSVGAPGFSRQVVSFASNAPILEGAAYVGQGTHISDISRVRDTFLDIQIRAQQSEVEYYSTIRSSLTQLASLFPDIINPLSTSGIEQKLTDYFAAWNALGTSATPMTDLAAKQNVINRGIDIALELRTVSVSIGNLKTSLNVEVENKITEVNLLLNQIAALNGQILNTPANVRQPNDLLDARDRAMFELSGLMEIRTVKTSNGTYDILFEYGELVKGTQVFEFVEINRIPDPEATKIGIRGDTQTAVDVTKFITRGSLGALLETRDVIIENAIQSIQSIGTGLIENTNLIYHAGEDSALGHVNFFNGNNAANIVVNPVLANSTTGAELISAYQDPATFTVAPANAPFTLDGGQLARDIASSQNGYSANYIQSFSAVRFGAPTPSGNVFDDDMLLSQAMIAAPYQWLLPLTVPPAGGVDGRLHVDISPSAGFFVDYNQDSTMLEIIQKLNQGLAGAGVASFDESTGKFQLVTSQPVSIYDDDITIGTLGTSLNLTVSLNSATNVNSTVNTVVRPVSEFDPLNSNPALLNYFKEFEAGGVFRIDQDQVNWVETQDLATILGAVPGATAGSKFAIFNPVTQRVTISSNPGFLTAATPLQFFDAADVSGDFLANLSIGKSASLGQRYDAFQADLSIQRVVTDANLLGAEATLEQLETLQAEKSAVNLDEEIAKSLAYQRAYEASVRVLSVIDQMLNKLINNTASPSSSSSSSTFG